MKQGEIVLDADIQNLARLNAWLDEFTSAGLPPKERGQLELAVEEIFVNIASYAYAPQTGPVVVRGKVMDTPSASIELIFMDEGRPFDPLAREDPPTDVALKDRAIGGLGIFLVKKIMDEVSYRREAGKNILALRKNISCQEA